MLRHRVLFLVFLAVALVSSGMRVGAVDFLSAGGGVCWIYSSVEDAAPDPVLFEMQVRFSVYETGGFFVRPAVSYFSTAYEWREGFALPSEDFVLESATVHVLSLKPRVGYEWVFGETELSWSLYPVGLIRGAFDGGTGAADAINGYLWSGARFLALESGVDYVWAVENGLSMGVFIGAQFPVSNWWTGESPSSLHGLSVTSGFFLGP